MPYKLQRARNSKGWYVVNSNTKRKMHKRPKTRAKALEMLGALMANVPDAKRKRRKH